MLSVPSDSCSMKTFKYLFITNEFDEKNLDGQTKNLDEQANRVIYPLRFRIIIDIAFIIAVLLFVLVFSLIALPLKNAVAVPSVLVGITTVTGLVFAVDALLLTRFYSDAGLPTERIRASFYTIVLAVGAFFIGLSYLFILSNSQVLALKIDFTVFNISYVVAIALAVHLMYSDVMGVLYIRWEREEVAREKYRKMGEEIVT